jgi:hypothetical protein
MARRQNQNTWVSCTPQAKNILHFLQAENQRGLRGAEIFRISGIGYSFYLCPPENSEKIVLTGDAGTSLTPNNAEIGWAGALPQIPQYLGAQRVPAAQGHLLRWRSPMMSLHRLRRAAMHLPCGARNAAYCTFTTGC